MDRAIAALEEALAGIDDVAEQLRRATESLVLDFLRYPAEVTVCNNEVRSLDPGHRLAIVAKRDRYAARRCVTSSSRAAAQARFRTRTPLIAAFAVLDGQRRQVLVQAQRPLPGHLRGQRVRRVRAAGCRLRRQGRPGSRYGETVSKPCLSVPAAGR